MTNRILFVDDEFNVLAAIKRQLHKRFEIEIAKGGQDALERLKNPERYAVIVSDLRMPGVDGISLLSRARAVAPDVVRIILTGQVDAQSAMTAINEASVFRFLTKPCEPDVLAKALEAALEAFRSVENDREVAEQTGPGTVALFTEILKMVNPPAFAKSERLRTYARQVGRALALECADLYADAALLSQLGCITLRPDAVERLEAGQPISPEEHALFQAHPDAGARLLGHVPELGQVAAMVSGLRAFSHRVGPSGDVIGIGSQVLRVVIAYDEMLVTGMASGEVLDRLRLDPIAYPLPMVEALAVMNVDVPGVGWVIGVVDVKPGMIFAEDVRSRGGSLLASRAQEATPSVIARLVECQRGEGVVEPFRVRVPAGQGRIPSRLDTVRQGA